MRFEQYQWQSHSGSSHFSSLLIWDGLIVKWFHVSWPWPFCQQLVLLQPWWNWTEKSPKLERKHKVHLPSRREEKRKSNTVEWTPLQNGPLLSHSQDQISLLVNTAAILWSGVQRTTDREREGAGGGVCWGLTRALWEASSRWALSVRLRYDLRCTRPPFWLLLLALWIHLFCGTESQRAWLKCHRGDQLNSLTQSQTRQPLVNARQRHLLKMFWKENGLMHGTCYF